MRTRVHYTESKSGIETIAAAISQQAGQVMEKLLPAYMPERVALLFLGSDDHGGKPDKLALEFVSSLNKERVNYAALYGTSPKKSTAHLEVLRKALTEHGVTVLPDVFVCSGKGGLFSGGSLPTEADAQAAAAFAQRAMAEVEKKMG